MHLLERDRTDLGATSMKVSNMVHERIMSDTKFRISVNLGLLGTSYFETQREFQELQQDTIDALDLLERLQDQLLKDYTDKLAELRY